VSLVLCLSRHTSVSHSVVSGPPVVHCGSSASPQKSAGGFVRKSITKIVSDSERMRNTPIYVCAKLPFLVDIQQNVGELVLSIISCSSKIILENTLN
jgi:hypothetical protein